MERRFFSICRFFQPLDISGINHTDTTWTMDMIQLSPLSPGAFHDRSTKKISK